MRKSLLMSAALLIAVTAAPASAAVLAGDTDGTFTGVTGNPAGVSITNGGNTMKWRDPNAKTCVSWFFVCLKYENTDPFSTLTYTDTPFSQDIAPGTDKVQIGQLTWYNAVNGPTTPNFDADFSILFTITSPGAVQFTHMLDLNVNNTPNPTGDEIFALTTPGNTPLDLGDGLTIDSFSWEIVGNQGSFNNGLWKNKENKTSILALYANVSQAEAVPEPAALALFGLGLAGLGMARRRKAA